MSWKSKWRSTIPEITGETTVVKSYFDDKLVAFVYNIRGVITDSKKRYINDFEVAWAKWSLTIDPYKDFLSISLSCESVEKGGYCTDVSLTTNYGKTYFANHCFSPEHCKDWKNKKWIPIDTKPVTLNFVLFLQLTYANEPTSFVCVPWKKSVNFDKAPEIKMKCGNYDCYINKEVLMGSSPVFSAMFLSEMTESKDNLVDMSDFSFDTICLLIEFLNFGRLNKVNNLEELCILSDMYQIDSLHLACDLQFTSTVTEDNYVQKMIFAGTHRLYLCQHVCLNFIKKYYKEAVNSEDWEILAGIKDCTLLLTRSFVNKIKMSERYLSSSNKKNNNSDTDEDESDGNCSCDNCNE